MKCKYILGFLFLLLLIFIFIKIVKKELYSRNHLFPIDVVIAWAGENNVGDTTYSSGANRDEGVLKYEIRSILKNLPWIRNIYIFMDPPLKRPLWLNSPKVILINRCEYFDRKEDCPTMNSAAVYINMYKIKGLAEHFIYIDDDILILKKLKYTDFYTKDGKKLISQCNPKSERTSIYNQEKVKKGKIKPPKSPLKINSQNSHVPIPHFKSIFIDLQKEYPEWFKFVSSHKKRWCCCNNECPNPEDDCSACWEELAGELGIPHLEAYNQNKAIYKPLLKHIQSESYNTTFQALNTFNENSNLVYLNINNMDRSGNVDLIRSDPKEYEKKKTNILSKLEEIFP